MDEGSPPGMNDRVAAVETATAGPSDRNESSRAIKRSLERSCALCHRRKVRCDKKMPCATCTRLGVLCCYPSGTKTAPRRAKATISDIAGRLAQLERTIVAISSDAASRGPDQGPHKSNGDAGSSSQIEDGATDSDGSEARPEKKHLGMLLHDEGGQSGHYVNEILLSRLLEEEEDIQSVLASPMYHDPDTPETDARTESPSVSFALLSMVPLQTVAPSRDGEYTSFHPQKWQAIRLWQAYVQNVDPLIKLLHIPSAQATVFSAIDHPEKVPADVKSLLFAIYFAAVTSFSPDEVLALLSIDKQTALVQIRNGLEMALAASNVIERPRIVSLQALGLFTQIVRAHNAGRSVWVLNGIVIRLAQSIGLHRDPSRFAIPPFDAEMRRRLWWHIVTHDSRAAEDHGIALNNLDPTTDTRFPLTVDDNALFPGMTDYPEPPVGRFTEMTLCRVVYETGRTCQLLQRLLSTSASGNNGPSDSETARKELYDKLQATMESTVSVCNPVIPIQRVVAIMAKALVLKTNFVGRQQWLYRTKSKPGQLGSRVSEEGIIEACEILERYAELQTDELLQAYHWAGNLYPQYHVIFYCLWYLAAKPTGPNVERAWAAMDACFGFETARQERQGIMRDNGTKWACLNALKERAARIRNSATSWSGSDRESAGMDEMAVDTEISGWERSFDEGLALGWEAGLLDWDGLVDNLNGTSYEGMQSG